MSLTEEIKVLDNGYVKFIDSMGSEENIIESARMSTGRGFEGWEKDFALLDFLWRNKHTSPFEMCELVVEIQAPIFVFREWHRHRTQSYNEFSARYAQMPNLHYLPEKGRIQAQSTVNKQGSSDAMNEMFAQEFIEDLRDEQEHVYQNYESAIKSGVAKEVARINTPVSRYSKMRAKTDLLNWLRFLNLRLRPNAQYEIRQYAEAVALIIKQKWPLVYKLFEEYDLYAVSFSAPEIKYIREALETHRVLHDLKTSKDPMLANSNLTQKKLDEFIRKLELGGSSIL